MNPYESPNTGEPAKSSATDAVCKAVCFAFELAFVFATWPVTSAIAWYFYCVVPKAHSGAATK